MIGCRQASFFSIRFLLKVFSSNSFESFTHKLRCREYLIESWKKGTLEMIIFGLKNGSWVKYTRQKKSSDNTELNKNTKITIQASAGHKKFTPSLPSSLPRSITAIFIFCSFRIILSRSFGLLKFQNPNRFNIVMIPLPLPIHQIQLNGMDRKMESFRVLIVAKMYKNWFSRSKTNRSIAQDMLKRCWTQLETCKKDCFWKFIDLQVQQVLIQFWVQIYYNGLNHHFFFSRINLALIIIHSSCWTSLTFSCLELPYL